MNCHAIVQGNARAPWRSPALPEHCLLFCAWVPFTPAHICCLHLRFRLTQQRLLLSREFAGGASQLPDLGRLLLLPGGRRPVAVTGGPGRAHPAGTPRRILRGSVANCVRHAAGAGQHHPDRRHPQEDEVLGTPPAHRRVQQSPTLLPKA